MRLLNTGLFTCVLLVFGMGLVSTGRNNSSPAQQKNHASSKAQLDAGTRLKLNQNYGKIPLYFEPNEGQYDPQVKFISRGSGYTLFITPAEAVYVLKRGDSNHSPRQSTLSKRSASKGSSLLTASPEVLRLRLEGGNRIAFFEGMEEAEGKSNYFIGNDPSKWRTNITHYAKVNLKEVYPGIDMVYYGSQQKLEYDFMVKPGADPKEIRLKIEGAESSNVNDSGNLQMSVGGCQVVFKAPAIYQEDRNGKVTIMGKYVKTGSNELGFEVKGYDHSIPLVIDPVLDYSTFLGGTASEGANAIAVDGSGNAYVTGETGSINFPTTAGAYQTASGDIFVTELNANGSALVYSTFLGGIGGNEAFGIAVDGLGNAYVTGQTSGSFPTTSGAYQTIFGAGTYDAFVTKLNPSGNTLLYSTYLGGSGWDQGDGIAVDSSGSAYVTGYTYSTDFPTTTGAYQTTSGGTWDAFITKLNAAGTALVYSTYLGGSYIDYGYGIAVDSSGNAYVTGTTASTDFPTTAGVYQTTFGGSWDVFVAKLNAAGTVLVYSTYLDGSSSEEGYGITVDSSGNAYVTGSTESTNFPTTSGAYQTNYGGNIDAFVTKLNNTGSALLYSTYLGEGNEDHGNAIAVDGSGNAYVTGYTQSTNFPTTSGAYQTVFGGNQDAFMMELNAGGSNLIYSTYLGGGASESGLGIAVDGSGNAYVTGYTQSTNFPTTSGAYQTAFGGTCDVFVAKLSFPTPTPTPTMTPTPTATDSPTNSSTSTPSSTPTPTATYSSTLTNTLTNTPTLTNTSTATGTYTMTNTLTPTYTPTLTSTSTQTMTPTVSNIPTSTSLPSCSGFSISKNAFFPSNGPVSIYVSYCKYPGDYSLKVYNSAGEHVKTLDERHLEAPVVASYLWDGRNKYGDPCASGVYILYLVEPYDRETKRVLLLR